MTRIGDHRSALAFGPVVEVHASLDADALLQAFAYAERAGADCVWINDPGGRFPPEKRPVRDARRR